MRMPREWSHPEPIRREWTWGPAPTFAEWWAGMDENFIALRLALSQTVTHGNRNAPILVGRLKEEGR